MRKSRLKQWWPHVRRHRFALPPRSLIFPSRVKAVVNNDAGIVVVLTCWCAGSAGALRTGRAARGAPAAPATPAEPAEPAALPVAGVA